jgi:hypothetical protein
MNRIKKVIALVAALMLLGHGTANADLSGDFAPSNWTYSESTADANGPSGTLTSSQMQITSADWTSSGSAGYERNSVGSYTITIPNNLDAITFAYSYVTRDVDGSSFDMPSYTLGGIRTFLVATNIPDNGTETGTKVLDVGSFGGTSLVISQACTDCILDSATITITGFTGTKKSSRNSLRLDSAGTTTEKNNVVSCTPGKYTFLSGGSTAEVSNIQSYVYTLLVNGKAVSTLSSDNFRSVASHLFPTIAGNMAGTATLEGATWDLKGMSNYSAQCQVYATQSGGNIQSVTSEVHDAVALAAAAEAAANVARDKEIISTWNAANEELAKKYRDQRLAVQP